MSTKSAVHISSTCLANTVRYQIVSVLVCKVHSPVDLSNVYPAPFCVSIQRCFVLVVYSLVYRNLDSRCHDAWIYYRQHYTVRFQVVGYLSSLVVDAKGYKGPVKRCFGRTKPFFGLNGIFPITLCISTIMLHMI